jgi:hypothetical protein
MCLSVVQPVLEGIAPDGYVSSMRGKPDTYVGATDHTNPQRLQEK